MNKPTLKTTPQILLATLVFLGLIKDAFGAGERRPTIRVLQEIEMKCGKRASVDWDFQVLPPNSKKPVYVEKSPLRFPAFKRDTLGPFVIDATMEGHTWKFRVLGKKCKGEITGIIAIDDSDTGTYLPPVLLATKSRGKKK